MDIPEDDSEKTFFLIEVSIVYVSRHDDYITLYTGICLMLFRSHASKADGDASCPFSIKKGVRTETMVESRVDLGGIFLLSTLTEEFSLRISKEEG